MNDPIIQIKGLSRRFGKKQALEPDRPGGYPGQGTGPGR